MHQQKLEKGKHGFVVIEGISGFRLEAIYCLQCLKCDNEQAEVAICDNFDFGRIERIEGEYLTSRPPITPIADFFNEMQVRAQVCYAKIKPAQQKKQLVVCKNFTVSTRVNCRLTFSRPEWNLLFEIEERARGLCPVCRIEPNMTIFIDLPPKIAFDRFKSKNLDHPNGLNHYKKMRELFLEELDRLRSDQQIIIINGDRTKDEIYHDVVSAMNCLA